jgi:hypothetical protein
MERIGFGGQIYARNGAEYTGGGYPTLRRAIGGAQAKYYIHRWCPYTGYAEIIAGSDFPKNRLMRLATLALGAIPWALVIVVAGAPK